MVTTKQNTTKDLQKIKRRESNHNTTENHQFTKEGRKRGKKKQKKLRQKQKNLLESAYYLTEPKI